jgi:hypothetical protein
MTDRPKHYCEVLNKIIWKVAIVDEDLDTVANRLASHATDALFYKEKGTSTETITWDKKLEIFIPKKIK